MLTDYLVLGSGLSALTFSALMAQRGHRVTIIEAHEFPGGFGHTFTEGSDKHAYHFNAQLHYVWDCGEGERVHRILKKLNLHEKVPFIQYNKNGFDHMRLPGFSLDIPNDYDLLNERMNQLFPKHHAAITAFLTAIQQLAFLANRMNKPSGSSSIKHAFKSHTKLPLLKFYGKTLQQVFDYFKLPRAAQSLLASQWHDFLLPPNQLSFYCWLILFDGYMRGAYYPKYHFEQVIQALVSCIESHGGQIIYNQKVTQFSLNKKNITAVTTVNMQEPTQLTEYTAKQVVCNFDPKQAAAMIGFQHFSSRLRQQLSYDYSCSNFVVYGAVKDIDLRDYGFGNWNIFHSEQININQVFDDMYYKSNYTKPSFAITTPSLVSDDPKGCPPGHQIFQLLTVANYNYFKDLKLRNQKDYLQQKKQIYNTMLDVIEKHYVPHFREHVCFKMLGSPTTNESFCFAPEGNSYGSNMTPQNTRLNRLGFKTSLNNFYFCNASSGYAGFTSSFANGARLYEYLTDDVVPNDI